MIEREYIKENSFLEYVAESATAYRSNSIPDLEAHKEKLRGEMLEAADNLEFEKAAALRDQMIDIERKIDVLKKKRI